VIQLRAGAASMISLIPASLLKERTSSAAGTEPFNWGGSV
jgi:hypothetical protein